MSIEKIRIMGLRVLLIIAFVTTIIASIKFALVAFGVIQLGAEEALMCLAIWFGGIVAIIVSD